MFIEDDAEGGLSSYDGFSLASSLDTSGIPAQGTPCGRPVCVENLLRDRAPQGAPTTCRWKSFAGRGGEGVIFVLYRRGESNMPFDAAAEVARQIEAVGE